MLIDSLGINLHSTLSPLLKAASLLLLMFFKALLIIGAILHWIFMYPFSSQLQQIGRCKCQSNTIVFTTEW